MTESDSPWEPREYVIDPADQNMRLDHFLARELPQFSRMQMRKVISAGNVTVNGGGAKVSFKLNAGQVVRVELPPMPTAGPQPEEIPIDVLYEDEYIIAINKPSAMVVHPARGHWSGTLASALAFHFQQLSSIGGETRPGIVHRLDRDTSGVMVVAKTDPMHQALADQFAARTTEKEYWALTVGTPDRDRDHIDAPIGVHPYQREKMAIRAHHETSREAQTFYEVIERFRGFAQLKLLPKTGRTHQIRVHLAHVGYPVLCDRLYSGRAEIKLGEIAKSQDETIVLGRQALHARRIKLLHPATREPIEFVAPVPEDLATTLQTLRQFRSL